MLITFFLTTRYFPLTQRYFLTVKKDTLVIFAAGNSGNNGLKSVYTPCSSKNVLCVGSADLRDDVSDSTASDTHVKF